MLAGAYLRVSTEEQVEHGLSLAAQKSRLLAYCHSQNWDIYDFYSDDGYSGKNLHRPAIQRLISDCEGKKLQAVVVLKLDRLSRKQRDVLYLLEDVLDKNKIGFKSVTEPFDTTTPFGKAAIGMMAVFAQLERETIVERIRIAKQEAAKQGRYLGGPIAYGYHYDPIDKTIAVMTDEATVVRRIFNDYLKELKGYQVIATELNEQKIPPPRTATQWERGTIRCLLNNAFYAGYIEHSGIFYQGKHPPLISLQQWEMFQQLRNKKKIGTANRRTRANENLLTGIIYCGECGARVRYKKINKSRQDLSARNAYYVCYSVDGNKEMRKVAHCPCGHKRASIIENHVIKSLLQFCFKPQLCDKIAQERGISNKEILEMIKSFPEIWQEATPIEKQGILHNLIQRVRIFQDNHIEIDFIES